MTAKDEGPADPDSPPVSRRGAIRIRRLARILRLAEHQVGELTRRGRLPFSVSTIDGLHINPSDVAAWRIAARRRRRRR